MAEREPGNQAGEAAVPATKLSALWRRASTRGFTGLELTVVLVIILTLAVLLLPRTLSVIREERLARAQSDALAIANGIARFRQELGFLPQWAQADMGGPGRPEDRLRILIGPGDLPEETVRSPWTSTGAQQVGRLEDQLVLNAPGYRLATEGTEGWTGALVTDPITEDPWGGAYVVNVGLLDDGPGAWYQPAVWVLSAGPNGIVETLFEQQAASAVLGGDDVGIRLR